MPQQLRAECDTLNTLCMEKELERGMRRENPGECGEEPELTSTKRCWLGQIYVNVVREEKAIAERSGQDVMPEISIEAFECEVKARIAILKLLRPMCLSF